jgi:signal transduction histidine kinase
MRERTWPILATGFGALVLLIAFLGQQTLQKAGEIYRDLSSIEETIQSRRHLLNEIQSDLYLSGILIRDFLLDPTDLTAASYRQELQAIRSSIDLDLDRLGKLQTSGESALLEDLRNGLRDYWISLEPLLSATPERRSAPSRVVLRRQILPRRQAVLALADRIKALYEAQFKQEQEDLDQRQKKFLTQSTRMIVSTLALGLVVVGLSTYRVSRLERRAEAQRKQTEFAHTELRRLSQQLVRAQEDERRSISRELHDEVGQVLTGLRVELSNLRRLRAAGNAFEDRLEEARALAGQALQAVRDLAMGLRPSMLDDLGLEPALEWQARDFSRRTGVAVTVQVDGTLGHLSDAHRTCVYRVAQEALTNCARHAKAANVRVALHGDDREVILTVQDDGAGFVPRGGAPKGIGLIGIEERVRELGGKVSIFSQPGKGALLRVRLPLLQEVTS